MTQQQQYDPISLTIALATAVFAPEVANAVAPYLVIVFASSIGASFALASRETTTRLMAALFFLRVNGLAVLLTYTFAAFVNSLYPLDDLRSWFSIIAFGIGFVGDRWPLILDWAGRKLARAVDLLIELRAGGKRD